MSDMAIKKQFLFINHIKYDAHFFKNKDIEYCLENFSYPQNISSDLRQFYREAIDFLHQWFQDSPYLEVQTSGSTGSPKVLSIEKKYMIASASMTCDFLGLSAKDTALLCMPLRYIGAKMMLVRALVTNMNILLQTPSRYPLTHIAKQPDFIAMVPLQVMASLAHAEEKEKLKNTRELIIGGASIDPSLEKELKDFPHNVWSTYGMTETLSHIALRKINGEASPYYQTLDPIKISTTEEKCLVIHAPHLGHERLETNDIVELKDEKSFRILGRKDLVVNSGGIKIQIEQVEQILKEHIELPFAISSQKDTELGEKLIFVSEKPIPNIEDICKNVLPKHHKPKLYLQITEIPRTESGKIARHTLKSFLDKE